jgi:hypothetical protein
MNGTATIEAPKQASPEQAKQASPEQAKQAKREQAKQAKQAKREQAKQAKQASAAAVDKLVGVAKQASPSAVEVAQAQTAVLNEQAKQAKQASPEPEQAKQAKQASPEPEQAKQASPEPEQAKQASPEPEQAKQASPEPRAGRAIEVGVSTGPSGPMPITSPVGSSVGEVAGDAHRPTVKTDPTTGKVEITAEARHKLYLADRAHSVGFVERSYNLGAEFAQQRNDTDETLKSLFGKHRDYCKIQSPDYKSVSYSTMTKFVKAYEHAREAWGGMPTTDAQQAEYRQIATTNSRPTETTGEGEGEGEGEGQEPGATRVDWAEYLNKSVRALANNTGGTASERLAVFNAEVDRLIKQYGLDIPCIGDDSE